MKKLLATILAIGMLISCIFVPGTFSAVAETGDTSYVIWEADPLRIEEGASALPTYFGYEPGKGSATVVHSDGEPYYSLSFTGTWQTGGGTGVSSKVWYNEADAYLGWLNQAPLTVLEAIKDYVTFTVELSSENVTGNVTTYITALPEKYGSTQYNSIYYTLTSKSVSNTWQTFEVSGTDFLKRGNSFNENLTWKYGALYVFIGDRTLVDSSKPAVIKMRNVKMVVKESDRAAINNILSQIEGIDDIQFFTNEGLDSYDYFERLIKYDQKAEYSVNNNSVTVSEASQNGGTVSVSAEKAYVGTTVEINVTADNNKAIGDVSVSLADGTAVEVTNSNGKYNFVMPANDVTVNVTYVDELSYVIWEADPLRIEEGESAVPTNFGYQPGNGSATVVHSDGEPYYSLSLPGTWQTGGGTAVKGLQYNEADAYLGWLNQAPLTVLEAIKDYVTFTVELSSENVTGNVTTYITALPEKYGSTQYNSIYYTLTSKSVSNTWQTFEVSGTDFLKRGNSFNENLTWKYGALYVFIGDRTLVDSSKPAVIKMRNVKMVVKESDRAAINNILSQIEGIDDIQFFTNEGLDSYDYFERLIKYDQKAEYSVNNNSVTVTEASQNGGTVTVSAEKAYVGTTVEINVTADGNKAIGDVSVALADGTEVEVTNSNGKYNFVTHHLRWL